MSADKELRHRIGSKIHDIEVGLEELGEFVEVGVSEERDGGEDVPVVVDNDKIDFFRVVLAVFVHKLGTRVAFLALLCSEMQSAIVFKGNAKIFLC